MCGCVNVWMRGCVNLSTVKLKLPSALVVFKNRSCLTVKLFSDLF